MALLPAPTAPVMAMRQPASKRTPLFNGALECRLFEYKLVSGSMRRVKPGAPV